MNVSDIPQFVLITLDDPITSYAMSLLRPITQIRDQYGCGVRATFYVSIQNKTECDLVNALRQGRHEIATNTFNDQGYPNVEEIQSAMEWLNLECGVPLEEMRGFRAPQLEYNQETLDAVHELGLLYDASIATLDHRDSSYGRHHFWPFTFDEEVPTEIGCTDCENNATNPGLWEVPVWRLYDDSNNALIPMDYSGDATANLQTNFERHYNGNRAPMGIFIHAGWLQQNNFNLKKWIDQVQADHDDVHFITTYELLEWMRDPIKKRRYRTRCTDQESECFTPLPLACVFGTFNPTTCQCDCNLGYCTDAAGLCTKATGCGDIDGFWSDWDQSYPCCDEFRLLTRTCNNPPRAGDGADCEGASLMVENCFPEFCPDGGWTEFSDWSGCCEGSHTRTRECLASPSINAGRGCIGVPSESETCGPDVCKKAYYPDYSRGACQRLGFAPIGVDESLANNNFEDCCNEHFQYALGKCLEMSENPPIHGGWTEWTEAGPCCDELQVLIRTCTAPAPAYDGDNCEGPDRIEQECEGNDCVNGGWGEWSDYEPCCDRLETRTRTCLAPPETGCVGELSESISCLEDVCAKTFYPNFNRQVCARLYEGQTVDATLEAFTYSEPTECCTAHFSYNYDECIGISQIPVDGGWGDWSAFGPCCNGAASRFRACNSPAPKNGGQNCEGEPIEDKSCFPDTCDLRVSGGYSCGPWSTGYSVMVALLVWSMFLIV
jgi:hypothetical protein